METPPPPLKVLFQTPKPPKVHHDDDSCSCYTAGMLQTLCLQLNTLIVVVGCWQSAPWNLGLEAGMHVACDVTFEPLR